MCQRVPSGSAARGVEVVSCFGVCECAHLCMLVVWRCMLHVRRGTFRHFCARCGNGRRDVLESLHVCACVRVVRACMVLACHSICAVKSPHPVGMQLRQCRNISTFSWYAIPIAYEIANKALQRRSLFKIGSLENKQGVWGTYNGVLLAKRSF